ncbi:MAG: hypothetical protein RMK29_01280 [Myxococcales bacterium]|nr:hypothetical protein [Myxococcota bacterium]MDW8280310.1 hypothetical protein [Myxococcales bacterium]
MRICFSYEGPGQWSFTQAEDDQDRSGRLLRLRHWLAARKDGPLPHDGVLIGWMVRLVAWLARNQDPAEPLLRRLAAADLEEVCCPVGQQRRAWRLLKVFLCRKRALHRRGLLLNLLLLPLSALLTVVPGPNVVFFWNAYRLVGHALALRGIRRTLRRMKKQQVRLLPPTP